MNDGEGDDNKQHRLENRVDLIENEWAVSNSLRHTDRAKRESGDHRSGEE